MTGTRNAKISIIITSLVLVLLTFAVVFFATDSKIQPESYLERAQRILDKTPIIDGHNDFPWNARNLFFNDIDQFDFNRNLSSIPPWSHTSSSHTDLVRLRAGKVGGQFWVAYVACGSQYKDSVGQTVEQIDVIHRLVTKYEKHMQFARSTEDIENSWENGKIASLIGVEGGHSIQYSFGILRQLYDLGARYLTLTHSCNTPWADASPVDGGGLNPVSHGLSEFGLSLIDEMNRIGMIIDLSHVSHATMKQALERSRAPVIFSHSSSFTICPHHRNVKDDMLKLTQEKGGLVMVNFYNNFIKCDSPRDATLMDVVEHIDYIRNMTSVDNVGLGGDYDGVSSVPEGLEDVSKYPDLIAALLETGRWSEEDIEKLASKNLMRVFKKVEEVRDSLQDKSPIHKTITREEVVAAGGTMSCITQNFPSSANDDVESEIVRNKRNAPEFY